MGSNLFPVDIWSIKEFGIEKWYENFVSFPVTEEEKYSIYLTLYRHYSDLILASDRTSADLLIVLYKLLMEYHLVLYSLLTAARCNERGYTVLVDDKKRTFIAGMYENEIEGIFIKDKILLNPNYPKYRYNLTNKLKMVARRFKYRLNNDVYSLPFGKVNELLSYGYPKPTLIEYARDQKKQIKLIYPYPMKKRHDADNHSEGLSVKLLDIVKDVAREYDIVIPEKYFSYLNKITTSSLVDVSELVTSFSSILKEISTTEVLVPAFGRTDVRALCVAAKNTGHKIVGSTHGSNVGFYKHHDWYNIDLCLSDKYIVPSSAAVQAMKNYQKTFKLSKRYKANIISRGTNNLSLLTNQLKSDKIPNEYRNIMVVEFAQTPYLLPQPMLTGYFQLWLNIKIANILRGAGYNTIIKVHPDRLAETAGIYDKYYDKVITERFETSYKIADALVFPEIASSTFPFALMTNRKVLIFETSMNNFIIEHAHEYLRKRAIVIDSKFDERGNFLFNDSQLINNLTGKPKIPDYGIIEKYYMNDIKP